ncbi:MAG: hypothetical protein ACOCPQ_05445 [Desulfosudaceae bacterium]
MTETIIITACGLFFLTGLATGIWKYLLIRRSPDYGAPRYVSTSHRAALMYSFACLVLLELTRLSALPDLTETVLVALIIAFFAAAQGSYLIHGLLRDTDNQLARPHRLGSRALPAPLITLFMTALIIVETGGFLVLLVAALAARL